MKWFKHRRNHKLEKRIADLEAELEANQRKLQVAEAEIESLAAVIARDRARIESETAAYSRKKAEAEGMTTDEHGLDQSIRRFTA